MYGATSARMYLVYKKHEMLVLLVIELIDRLSIEALMSAILPKNVGLLLLAFASLTRGDAVKWGSPDGVKVRVTKDTDYNTKFIDVFPEKGECTYLGDFVVMNPKRGFGQHGSQFRVRA